MSSIPNSFSHVLLRTFYDRFSPRGKRPLNPFQRSAQACAFYEVVFLASKTKASPVSAAGHSVTDPALKVIKKKNKAKPANIPRCTPGSFWQGKASPPCPRPFRNPSSGRRARRTDGRTDGGGGKGGGPPRARAQPSPTGGSWTRALTAPTLFLVSGKRRLSQERSRPTAAAEPKRDGPSLLHELHGTQAPDGGTLTPASPRPSRSRASRDAQTSGNPSAAGSSKTLPVGGQ